jgi:hypothetical protein
MIGPFALAICAMRIAGWVGGWFGPLDVVYFVLLGRMPAGRLMEFRHGRPTTATGEPATPAHLRRYALVLTVFGLGVWIAAKLASNQPTRFLG